VREAQLANLMIQAIDPKGLRSQAGTNAGRGGVLNIPEPADPLRETAAMRVEFLRMMAETTGGRAVVNNNDMQEEVQALLAEGSGYYLLGIERPPAANDGRLRRVAVRVNRPELTVRTRSGYFDTTGP